MNGLRNERVRPPMPSSYTGRSGPNRSRKPRLLLDRSGTAIPAVALRAGQPAPRIVTYGGPLRETAMINRTLTVVAAVILGLATIFGARPYIHSRPHCATA